MGVYFRTVGQAGLNSLAASATMKMHNKPLSSNRRVWRVWGVESFHGSRSFLKSSYPMTATPRDLAFSDFEDVESALF